MGAAANIGNLVLEALKHTGISFIVDVAEPTPIPRWSDDKPMEKKALVKVEILVMIILPNSPTEQRYNNQLFHGNGSSGLNSSSNGAHNTSHHNSSGVGEYQYGRFDASALHIAHALRATKLQRAYGRPREKPIDCYLVS
ncbi:hypothetical protein J437_LFUL003350 [Ladona fulva]|uniref:Uncharacterized protein n=1 Tax=Ladona fulva TaxID=123851 RepID=A0A8K0NZ29_LADFU|nr:hypothetical protein J437_LFUL003350 [Ladona fulva]